MNNNSVFKLLPYTLPAKWSPQISWFIMKIIVSYICTQCFSVVNTLSLKMLSHLAFEHLTCPKRSETWNEDLSLQCGSWRSERWCQLPDDIQHTSSDSWSNPGLQVPEPGFLFLFFFLNAYGWRETSHEPLRWSQRIGNLEEWALWLGGPHFSKRQFFSLSLKTQGKSKCLKRFIAKPLPQTSGTCEMRVGSWRSANMWSGEEQQPQHLAEVPVNPSAWRGASVHFIFMAHWLLGTLGLWWPVLLQVDEDRARSEPWLLFSDFKQFKHWGLLST